MSRYDKSKIIRIDWFMGIVYLYVFPRKKTVQLLIRLRKTIYEYARSGLISWIRTGIVLLYLQIYKYKNIYRCRYKDSNII